jgi:hypothetical protein
MRPLGLGNGAFDSDMVNLTIIVHALPFSFEIRVSTSSDSQNGAVSGEGLELLRRFLGLLREWRWGGFGSFLTWLLLVLLGVGYVICGVVGG